MNYLHPVITMLFTIFVSVPLILIAYKAYNKQDEQIQKFCSEIISQRKIVSRHIELKNEVDYLLKLYQDYDKQGFESDAHYLFHRAILSLKRHTKYREQDDKWLYDL